MPLGRQRPCSLPWITLLLSGMAVALTLHSGLRQVGIDLEGAVVLHEPWRLFTGSLVHAGPTHLLTNLAVFVPLSLLRERGRGSLIHLGQYALLAAGVALAVRLCHRDWVSYCGLSGVVYGLLTLWLLDSARAGVDRTRLIPWIALALLAAKTGTEWALGGWIANREALSASLGVTYLPGSHAGGMLAAALLALATWSQSRGRLETPGSQRPGEGGLARLQPSRNP